MGHRIPSNERLADPGTLLATTHPVADDLRVRLRLARPGDRPRVRDFLDRLSSETPARRFAHAMPGVSETLVHHFTFYDPRSRLVVVAVALDGGSSEEIVGLADVTHLDAGLAGLGVVVDDRRQGRGVGKLLTEVVASLAMQQGTTRLKGELLTENPAMLHLMQRLGRTVSVVEDGVPVVYATLPASRRRAA